MIVKDAEQQGRVIGLHLSADDEDATPRTAPPSRSRPLPEVWGDLPERIEAISGNQIYIPQAGMPASLAMTAGKGKVPVGYGMQRKTAKVCCPRSTFDIGTTVSPPIWIALLRARRCSWCAIVEAPLGTRPR